MKKNKTLIVEGAEIKLFTQKDIDFISLTDIIRKVDKRTDLVIQSWMRNMSTIEYLGLWEELHNPNFNPYGFAGIKEKTGSNTFYVSIRQWIQETNAIGLQSKAGRYGGTYAHKDIAINFCYWLSPKFQILLIKEFQRLKEIESEQQKETLEWNVKRTLAKVNYRIHTEAIKENLIPSRIYNNPKKEGFIYANEADILNVALFGITAKMWRSQNPDKKGNIRDYATTEQLIVLSNLESQNAQLIKEGLSQDDRLDKLNEIAIYQMQVLTQPFPAIKKLTGK